MDLHGTLRLIGPANKTFVLALLLISAPAHADWKDDWEKALTNMDDPFGSESRNSLRIDVPKDKIPPRDRLMEGKKYLDVTRPEVSDMEPIFKLAREIMKGREQK